MKSMAFALYNQLKDRSESYVAHVREITMFYANDMLKKYSRTTGHDVALIEGNDITEILKAAGDTDAEYLYMIAMGYTSFDGTLFNRAVEEAEEKGYAVVGHILEDKPEGYFQFHPQCLLVNLNAWRKAGQLEFGSYTNLDNVYLPVAVRSQEDAHDDYTPTYLRPSWRVERYTGPVKEGWNLIVTMLKEGYSIGNFSNDIRGFKSHLYPEMSDTRFERILAGDNTITVEENGPTYGQFLYLRCTDFSAVTGDVFVFNNDSMNSNQDPIKYSSETKLNTLYAVAAGFKPIQLLTRTDWSSARVVYIDYSQQALDFRKWLWQCWDGKDYIQAITDYKQMVPSFNANWLYGKDMQQEWYNTIEIFGGLENWEKTWARYQQLPHEFIKTNLFGDCSAMLEDMRAHQGNNLIWFSNSFYTPASVRNFAPGTLDDIYLKFENDVKAANISIQFGGCDNKCKDKWMHCGQIQ